MGIDHGRFKLVKLVTIIGARPQFVKAAVVSRTLDSMPGAYINEVVVHTGQHYSTNMSDIFFDELGIKEPTYNLGIASLSHGAMTGQMLEKIEEVLKIEKPDAMLIYGDTNSTLAGALAAVKLHIPLVHIEAGLRSFNMRMPEEVNRIIVDRISNLLFCPSDLAMNNLRNEGITHGIHWVGDVMFDAVRIYGDVAIESAQIDRLADTPDNFVLATVHRAENTDDPIRLREIFRALSDIAVDTEVILPLHPRTQNILKQAGLEDFTSKLNMTEPLSYTEMLVLEKGARAILTDSGGIQKEAYFHGTPCITLRDETEWIETVDLGWNRIVGADHASILDAWRNIDMFSMSRERMPYGDGYASEKIAEILVSNL